MVGRGGGMGAIPHGASPLPTSSLLLVPLGQVPYSGGSSDLSCHLTALCSIVQDYFLSTRYVSETMNKRL